MGSSRNHINLLPQKYRPSAYSRRVIGWALDRTLEDELTLMALRMALSRRNIHPGLVQHSDRGSQYASTDYSDLLKAHQIDISMSRKGNPWDNAARESFSWATNVQITFTNNAASVTQANASSTGFTLQRALDSGFTTVTSFPTTPASPGVNTVSYVDPTALPATTYLYRVEAFTKNGISGWSNIAEVGLVPTITLAPPSPLVFADQLVGSTSAVQTITVSNGGLVPSSWRV